MADELRINIGADVSDFEKGVQQVNKGLTSLQKSSAQTGTTLTNLSRIAQDAPFGFIAIQNNLDPLIQSFGSLSKESGGTGNAIKALAGSLVGPAGLALGFSVVTALVTSAIQKYGSLSNAVSEFASSSDIAAVNQRKLSATIAESVAGTQGEVNTLRNYIGILNDINAPQQERINAYNTLKKEFPAVIQNLSVENALTAQGGQLIQQRSAQLIQYIQLKGKEKALIALIEKEYDGQLKTLQSANNLINDQDTFLNKLINVVAGGGNAFVGFGARINSFSKEINQSSATVGFFEKTLQNLQKEIAKTDPNIIDPAAATKAANEAAKAAEAAAKAATAANKKAEAKRLKELEDAKKKELKLSIQTGKLITAYREGESKLAQAELQKIAQENADFEKQQLKDLQNDVAIGGQAILQGVNQSFKALSTTIEEAQLRGQTVATLFSQVFNPIVDQFFANIEAGQNVFKGLGDVVKQFVKNAIIQLIKLAAFSAITSAFSGGTVSFGSAFKSGLGSAFGLPKMGGVSAGGLNVNVAGQFALRGSDLVASVGSAQQSINRVG